MKISLCTIVKNDAILLPRLLSSVLGVVDEIVIADTGSTDATIDVIKSFAVEHEGLVNFLHYEWKDDFSAARNFVLDHASGDWVLVLDGDEFLEPCNVTDLRSTLKETRHDGLLVKIRNYTGSMADIRGEVELDAVRLFRSHYRYVGMIHEQIVEPIRRAGGTIGQSNLLVHHLGYLDEYRKIKRKNERNTELLKRQIQSIRQQDKIHRWHAITNLLAEYQVAGRWEEVASQSRLLLEEIRANKAQRKLPFLKRIYHQCVTSLQRLGRLEEALRTAREAVSLFPAHTDTQLLLAETYVTMRQYAEAMDVLKICREIGDVQMDTSNYLVGAGTYISARLMAYCWLQLGDDLSAREWFMTSFSENMSQAGVIAWLVRLTPEPQVAHELERLIHTPQRYEEFLLPYVIAGHDDAQVFIERARQQWGDQAFVRRAEFAYAIRHESKPCLPNVPRPGDYVRWGLWLFEQGDVSMAIHAWQQAGPQGTYLIRLVQTGEEHMKWEVATLLDDLLATRSTRLLSQYSASATDLSHHFSLFLHTDLKGAFTTEAFLNGPSGSHQEWEWRAMLHLHQGSVERASDALSQAVLPDGHLSVRGYLLAGDVEPKQRTRRLQDALKRYPDSKLLQYVRKQHFSHL
ncbi:glycosyltransferase [Alicyclobacillus macrosporangiidus]|uniref:Glycosyltransferase involved in cell wall bisynthesis n=1 Tax=Alicyclobacillus macrosporangiidus TaxID=392015 RepID=A0A1I7L657_9BACL|nr:glycosyltransferase [Alicyclobacillus macrosporangiidus]SFV05229.1 Glycosyltransferase involved in cell wall bisynthesis [Alicyclobacillus macrosporangiidus]